MKKLFYILICLCLLDSISGQTSEIYGKVKTTQTKEVLPFALISLKQDTATIATTSVDLDGNYKLTIKNAGTYTLITQTLDAKDIKLLTIEANEKKEIDLFIPVPCQGPYSSPVKCPDGLHTDNIVPMVYGLATKKMFRQAAKGKIVLGGCFPSCEKYYCKTHKKAF